MNTIEFYKEFWKEKERPIHKQEDEGAYKRYAGELNLVLDWLDYNDGPVYEVGCGDGSMFPFLKINHSEYVARDLSEKMVKTFKSKYPEIDVAYGDGTEIPDIGKKYGLILGYTVHHNFNEVMLEEHVRQASGVLSQGGILLIGGQPLKTMKYLHYSKTLVDGEITFKKKLFGLYSLLNISKKHKLQGYWHSLNDVKKMAMKHNFEFHVFGSVAYPWRVNIGLKKK